MREMSAQQASSQLASLFAFAVASLPLGQLFSRPAPRSYSEGEVDGIVREANARINQLNTQTTRLVKASKARVSELEQTAFEQAEYIAELEAQVALLREALAEGESLRKAG